jgi:hypothetical protein
MEKTITEQQAKITFKLDKDELELLGFELIPSKYKINIDIPICKEAILQTLQPKCHEIAIKRLQQISGWNIYDENDEGKICDNLSDAYYFYYTKYINILLRIINGETE